MIDTSGLPFPKNSPSAGKHPQRLTPTQFRDQVWRRDNGRSRVSGQRLYRALAVPLPVRGEVCHLRGRRVDPARVTDVTAALLMSAEEHIASDGRGGYRLKLLDPVTEEKATDASKPILFVMHDGHGRELWRRVR